MSISTIISILEDMEQDENEIKLLFRKSLNYDNKEERLFISIKKYCKISYIMVNNEDEVPIWATSVLQDIKRMIERKQGIDTVQLSEEKSLYLVYQAWKAEGSKRKKEGLEKFVSLLHYRKQMLLKEEYTKKLMEFEEQTRAVLE